MKIFIPIIAVLILLSSCGSSLITKRKHRSGYHVHLFESKKETRSENNSKPKDKASVNSLRVTTAEINDEKKRVKQFEKSIVPVDKVLKEYCNESLSSGMLKSEQIKENSFSEKEYINNDEKEEGGKIILLRVGVFVLKIVALFLLAGTIIILGIFTLAIGVWMSGLELMLLLVLWAICAGFLSLLFKLILKSLYH